MPAIVAERIGKAFSIDKFLKIPVCIVQIPHAVTHGIDDIRDSPKYVALKCYREAISSCEISPRYSIRCNGQSISVRVSDAVEPICLANNVAVTFSALEFEEIRIKQNVICRPWWWIE